MPRAAPADVSRFIGNTPLVRVDGIAPEGASVEVYAKLEWMNPGGSVKDRPALFMVDDAERRGLLENRRILDATSGNTGIALAMIGASRGHGVTLCVPENASPERIRAMRAFGADLVLTNPLEGTDGAQRAARALAERRPETFAYLDQYNNPANWRAHYETTAPEVLRRVPRRITHFVAGLGTTGTLVGTSRRLREARPDVRIIAVEPDGPLHGIEGLKHLSSALVPGIWNPSAADEHVFVGTEEAQQWGRRLAREEGLLVGTSSGAAAAACARLATRIRRGTIVTIFPDGAPAYLREQYWEQRS